MDMNEPNEAPKAKLAVYDAITRLRKVKEGFEILVANLHENPSAE